MTHEEHFKQFVVYPLLPLTPVEQALSAEIEARLRILDEHKAEEKERND